MARAAKACGQPGCPHFHPCPDHRKIAWAGSTRRSRLPPDWERRRRSVLARDPICTICHQALSREVHHTGDPDDHALTQLAGVCPPCHQTETQKQAAAARGTR